MLCDYVCGRKLTIHVPQISSTVKHGTGRSSCGRWIHAHMGQSWGVKMLQQVCPKCGPWTICCPWGDFFLWPVTTVIYALWKTDTVTILKKVQINLDPLNLVSHWIKTCTTSDFCSKEAWKQLFLSLTFAKENKSFNRKRDIHPFIVAESRGGKLINEMQFKIGVKKYKNDHVKSAEEINVTLERRWRQIAHSY